jgi:hypothetical protein
VKDTIEVTPELVRELRAFGSNVGRSVRLSDDAARAILEELLEIRRQANAGQALDAMRALIVKRQVIDMVRKLMQPLADFMNIKINRTDFFDIPVEDARTRMARTIEHGLPLPQGVAHYLADSLRSLNAGYIEELFERTEGRRGVEPHIIYAVKLKLLMFIRYQYGRGGKIAEAQAEVASKIGRTHEAIAKWRRDVPKVFREEQVGSFLKFAELVGRAEVAQTGSVWVTSEEIPALQDACQWLVTDLDELARSYKSAVTRRKLKDYEVVEVRT